MAADKTATLFVVRGDASVSEQQLTLTPDSVEWFTDSPVHEAGMIDTAKFEEIWSSGLASPAPNAAIVGNGVNAVLELDNMTAAGDAIHFDYNVVRGTLSDTDLGEVTLFIDPIQETMTITDL